MSIGDRDEIHHGKPPLLSDMWAKLGVPPPPLTNTAVALSEGDEETDPPGPEESSPGGRRLDVIEVPNRSSDSDILRDDESRGGVGLKKIGHL